MNLKADLPPGWSVATANGQTRFSSPDQKEYLTVAPLTSLKISDFGDDFDRYLARGVEEARQIGGVNIQSAEGLILFDLPDLSQGEIFNVDDNSFILTRQGGSRELEALHWSIYE